MFPLVPKTLDDEVKDDAGVTPAVAVVVAVMLQQNKYKRTSLERNASTSKAT